MATKHGVTGWVRNLRDGRVEALLEGYETDVRQVIDWCHVGPPRATVNDVEIMYEKYTGEFEVFRVSQLF